MKIDFELSPTILYALLGTCTEEYLKLLHNNFASNNDKMFLRGAKINSSIDKEFSKKQNNLLYESLRLGLNSSSGRVGMPVSKKFSEYRKYTDLLSLIEKYGKTTFELTKNFDWKSLNEHVIFSGGKTKKELILKSMKVEEIVDPKKKKDKMKWIDEIISKNYPLIQGDGDLLFSDKLVDIKVKKKCLFTVEDIVQQIMYYDLSNNAEWLNGEVKELYICNPIYNFLRKIEIFYN